MYMENTGSPETENERNVDFESAGSLNGITSEIVGDTYSDTNDSRVDLSHLMDEAASDSSDRDFRVQSNLPSPRRSGNGSETLITPPVVSAENALQLHFGPISDESMHISSISDESPDVITPVYNTRSDKNEGVTHLEYTTQIPDCETGIQTDVQSLRVRFRSRVRIGSGIRKQAGGRHSAGSSPSSSISVPLRYQADGDESGSSCREDGGGMPISYDDTFDATTAQWLQRHMMSPGIRRKRKRHLRSTDERSPLISHASGNRSYDRSQVESSNDENSHDEENQMAARKIQEDAIFGEWPGRLLSRHWWWWKLNPVLCYCCNETDDETDAEEL